MCEEGTSAMETSRTLDKLTEPGFWVSQKNRVIGILAAIALAAVVIVFFQRQGSSKQEEAWVKIIDPEMPNQLRNDPNLPSEVQGTTAEP